MIRKAVLASSVCLLLLAATPLPAATGHWEFNFHYSGWTLNFLTSGLVDKAVTSGMKSKILDNIQEDYPNYQERDYSQTMNYSSSGHNCGFEVRYYPAGEKGSFSLGLAVEKSSFSATISNLSSTMHVTDSSSGMTGTYTGTASASGSSKPLSLLLNVRWDIFPTSRIHPYVTFGVGASTVKSFLDTKYAYEYSGTLVNSDSTTDEFSSSESKTLRDLRNDNLAEGKSDLPVRFMPFVQLNIGIKARLVGRLYALADFGILNGILFRGGLAYRI